MIWMRSSKAAQPANGRGTVPHLRLSPVPRPRGFVHDTAVAVAAVGGGFFLPRGGFCYIRLAPRGPGSPPPPPLPPPASRRHPPIGGTGGPGGAHAGGSLLGPVSPR